MAGASVDVSAVTSHDFDDLSESWKRPSGIYIVAPIEGELADQVREIQQRYDPKLAAHLPPHLTIGGSSGMGPIEASTPIETLREVLEPIARTTPPLELAPLAPMRFMQTEIVVVPFDPHGPVRELHDRIRASGLRYKSPRFTFTPHVTLSFYRELTPTTRRELLAVRPRGVARISKLVCSLTDDPHAPRNVLELSLSG
jgi:2'-5' RNA ligase